MIAIGDVKWGNRIEPINVHELSREELNRILEEQDIELDTSVAYPIDSRIVSVFRTDRQKLGEYISACKYAFNRKDVKKPKAKSLSIFGDSLQIHYELKNLKEAETLNESEKLEIYKHAKDTQALFKMFGANNVKLEMGLLDRAYFEVQRFIQNLRLKRNVQALPEGNGQTVKPEETARTTEGEYRKSLFDREAQIATSKVSANWREEPRVVQDKEEKEVI